MYKPLKMSKIETYEILHRFYIFVYFLRLYYTAKNNYYMEFNPYMPRHEQTVQTQLTVCLHNVLLKFE